MHTWLFTPGPSFYAPLLMRITKIKRRHIHLFSFFLYFCMICLYCKRERGVNSDFIMRRHSYYKALFDSHKQTFTFYFYSLWCKDYKHIESPSPYIRKEWTYAVILYSTFSILWMIIRRTKATDAWRSWRADALAFSFLFFRLQSLVLIVWEKTRKRC